MLQTILAGQKITTLSFPLFTGQERLYRRGKLDSCPDASKMRMIKTIPQIIRKQILRRIMSTSIEQVGVSCHLPSMRLTRHYRITNLGRQLQYSSFTPGVEALRRPVDPLNLCLQWQEYALFNNAELPYQVRRNVPSIDCNRIRPENLHSTDIFKPNQVETGAPITKRSLVSGKYPNTDRLI